MANRMIDDDFLKDLQSDGILSPVVDLVKEKNLILSFRGNYINVYHNSHSIYKIVQKKMPGQKYRVEFDFNHARYTKSYITYLNELKNLGFKLSNNTDNVAFDYRNEEKKYRSGNNKIYTYISDLDYQFWMNSSNILIALVNDFFSNNGKDYFCGEVIKGQRKNNKNRFLEKKRQQEIALANRNADNPFFIYDIEYAEPNGKNKGVPGKLIGKRIVLPTVPKTKKSPVWFSATIDGINIFINEAVSNKPFSRMSMERKLTYNSFEKVYPFYLRRENGEQVSREVVSSSLARNLTLSGSSLLVLVPVIFPVYISSAP